MERYSVETEYEVVLQHGFSSTTKHIVQKDYSDIEGSSETCILDFGGSWEDYIPLIEFVYNDGYQSSIGMAPYKAIYGKKYMNPLTLIQVRDRQVIGSTFVDDIIIKILLIRERLNLVHDRQKYYNQKHMLVEFQIGDLVYVKVSPM